MKRLLISTYSFSLIFIILSHYKPDRRTMEFQLYNKSQKKTLPPPQDFAYLDDPSTYIPSEGLENAVNVALALGKPLLLTGEPGTGKTQLASHISYIFDLGEPIQFNAKTTSSVKDLFYQYDALAHFQYSQTSNVPLTMEDVESRFIRYVGLGKAIKERKRAVVLIDEIDKAPRDLPNDILFELEKLSFYVPEINKSYQVENDLRPVIILTSNSEKNLPDAFLRRVTYYHIPFPNEKALLEILQAKFKGYDQTSLQILIRHFEQIRDSRKYKLQKNPATAELINWVQLLVQLAFDANQLKDIGQLNDLGKKQLGLSYSVLAKTKEDLVVLKKGLV